MSRAVGVGSAKRGVDPDSEWCNFIYSSMSFFSGECYGGRYVLKGIKDRRPTTFCMLQNRDHSTEVAQLAGGGGVASGAFIGVLQAKI